MTDGRRRTSTPFRFPPMLKRAPGPPVTYLDLNQWVYLAQAATNHPNGARHAGTLKSLRRLVTAGELTIVTSSTTYMEISLIADPRQRQDLAEVIEELTGFKALLCAHLIMRLEVETVLDQRIGPRLVPYAPLDLIGTGFGHALGVSGQLQIRGPDGKTTEHVRAEWAHGEAAFDDWLADMQLEGERRFLRGPRDEDIAELRRLGWDQDAFRQIAADRATEEHAQAGRFNDDDRWRRGRIRDVLGARYMCFEVLDYLNEGVAARHSTNNVAFHDRASMRSFVDSMPSADARLSLLVARHRNPQSTWTANDIYDLDALSIAAAYCDVVVCESHVAHLLRQEGIAERLATTALNPTELATWLTQR